MQVYYDPAAAEDHLALQELQKLRGIRILVAEPWSERIVDQVQSLRRIAMEAPW